MKITESSLQELVLNEGTFKLLQLMIQLNAQRQQQLSFDQNTLMNSEEFKKFDRLKSMALRFDGLCELISNCVIANDVLGASDQFRSQLVRHKELFTVDQSNDAVIQLIHSVLARNATKNDIQKKVTLAEVDAFSESHMLDVYSHFQKMIAYFLSIYPFSLFSYGEVVQIGKQVNQPLFENKLNSLEDGSYIKFIVFKKGFFSFEGHAMVIKKTGHGFSFFDPNKGELINLTPSQVCEQVNETMQDWDATDMAFIDGKEYIQSLKNESRIGDLPSEIKQKHLNDDCITQFIFSELEKISEQKNISDSDLVLAMDNLRTGVEQLMQNRIAPVKNNPEKDTSHQLFIEFLADKNLSKLDDLRVQSKIEHWSKLGNIAGSKPVTMISSVDDIIAPMRKATPEELRLLLTTVSLSSLIKSPYELGALLSILDDNQAQVICVELQEKLSEIMPSARHVETVLRALTNYPEKKTMLRNMLLLPMETKATLFDKSVKPSISSEDIKRQVSALKASEFETMLIKKAPS